MESLTGHQRSNGENIVIPDVEGKYTDLEISHAGVMVDGDTMSFDVEVVDGQEQITESVFLPLAHLLKR